MKKEAWYSLYRLLKAIGMPKITVPVEIKKGPHTYTLPMGWPALQIAISLDSKEGKKFKQEGWQVVYVPANALNAAEPLVLMLDELSRKRTIADSFADAEMTVSKTENKLLNQILISGLSEPDRNFKFYDGHGSLITVPDFVWEESKVAVFVDGEFFHGLKDISDALQVALESDPGMKNEIVAKSKDTMARDAAKRRKLTKAGWKVIVVTASEIDTGDLEPIVSDIQMAMQQPISAPAENQGYQKQESIWILDQDNENNDSNENSEIVSSYEETEEEFDDENEEFDDEDTEEFLGSEQDFEDFDLLESFPVGEPISVDGAPPDYDEDILEFLPPQEQKPKFDLPPPQ